MIRPGIRKLFRLAFHRREDAARDVNEEMRLHIALRTEQLIGGGMAPEQARAIAEQKFGSTVDVQRMMEEAATHREVVMRKRELFESFTQDLRYVLRSLKRSPTFVISATLTLALGLGANAALFSILDRLYLQAPAGVDAPKELQRLYTTYTDTKGTAQVRAVLSMPEWSTIAATAPADQMITGFRPAPETPIEANPDGRKGVVTFVVGDYFRTLGVRTIAGRIFSADEVRPALFSPVAIVTSGFARESFGSDRGAIGKPFDVGTHRYTIVGVTPPKFRGTELDASDAWVPMNTMVSWVTRDTSWLKNKGTGMIHTVVRAPSAAALPAVTASARNALRFATIIKDTARVGVVLGSIRQMIMPGFNVSEEAIATRLAVVAFAILLIACANVANLLLARALQRRREIGVRLALGVSRGRLISQLLTESVVLALLGCIAAIVVAAWTATALRAALLPHVQWSAPAIGWRMVVFAAVSAVIAGCLAGLAPALNASKPNLAGFLAGGNRDGARHRSAVRSFLLISQIALSCVLLAGSGLFVRSLKQVEHVDIGYDQDRLVFASARIVAESGHKYAELDGLLVDAASRIGKLPGVERVALSGSRPMWGFSMITAMLPNGDTVPRLDGRAPTVSFVTPGFAATMGLHLVAGREITADDRAGSEPVIMVNAEMAKSAWPGETAIGKCLVLSEPGKPCRRVVGVASNAHYGGLVEAASMQYFVPLAQNGFDDKPSAPGAIEIRAASGSTAAVAAAVNNLLIQTLPTGIRPSVVMFSEPLAPQLRPWRLGAALFTAAGLLALLVAAVGIYGTIAYTFSQRTQEIGVRIALGAQSSSIVALVLKSSVMISAIGVVAGTVIALWAGKFAKPLLYETSPNNPFVLGGVGLVLLAVAVLASLVPALRAKRVDPIEALRAE